MASIRFNRSEHQFVDCIRRFPDYQICSCHGIVIRRGQLNPLTPQHKVFRQFQYKAVMIRSDISESGLIPVAHLVLSEFHNCRHSSGDPENWIYHDGDVANLSSSNVACRQCLNGEITTAPQVVFNRDEHEWVPVTRRRNNTTYQICRCHGMMIQRGRNYPLHFIRYQDHIRVKIWMANRNYHETPVAYYVAGEFHNCSHGCYPTENWIYHDGNAANLSASNVACRQCLNQATESEPMVITPTHQQSSSQRTPVYANPNVLMRIRDVSVRHALKRRFDEINATMSELDREITDIIASQPSRMSKAPGELTIFTSIECPVCKAVHDRQTAMSCGHMVCETCRPQLAQVCPICRGNVPQCPLIS